MLRFFIISAFVALVAAEKVTFENYKVFRVTPATEQQLKILKQIQCSEGNCSYWREPSHVLESADLMVSPEKQSEFTELMNNADMHYETYVEDVQRLIDEENPKVKRDGSFGWTQYHTLEEIYAYLDSLAAKYPANVKVVVGGKTYQGREIKGVKLSFSEDKPGVFIEGGIHAREWISPATVTYLINEFLTSQDSKVRKLAESYDWYVFPSVNPDGYVHSHTTNRMWRKTLSENPGSSCKGADGNRNYDYEWMTVGASSDPCSETHAGKGPFSEIETRTLSDYVKSIGDKLFAYIAFHSYSQLLMFPYGHTSTHLDNYEESKTMGVKAVEALVKRHGTKYRTGSYYETIYPHSGISVDWVKATLKLPVTFCYELRDTGRYGFILPADQIIPTGEEIVDSLVAMFNEANKYGYPNPQN